MKATNNNSPYFLPFLGIVVFILAWFFISYIGKEQFRLYLASPEEVLFSLEFLIRSQKLILDILATLARTMSAFLPAVFVGIILGFLLGSNRLLLSMFEVLIEFFRSIPAIAMLPIFILVFGISDIARVGVAFFVSFWVILINTIYGVTHMAKSRTKIAQSMKANSFQIFKYVIIWEILPYVFSGLRLAISISLVIVVISEMVIGPKYGLGIRLLESQQTFKVGNLYAIMVVMGMMGFVLNKAILYLERHTIHWTQG